MGRLLRAIKKCGNQFLPLKNLLPKKVFTQVLFGRWLEIGGFCRTPQWVARGIVSHKKVRQPIFTAEKVSRFVFPLIGNRQTSLDFLMGCSRDCVP
jgi:hypothetical protein